MVSCKNAVTVAVPQISLLGEMTISDGRPITIQTCVYLKNYIKNKRRSLKSTDSDILIKVKCKLIGAWTKWRYPVLFRHVTAFKLQFQPSSNHFILLSFRFQLSYKKTHYGYHTSHSLNFHHFEALLGGFSSELLRNIYWVKHKRGIMGYGILYSDKTGYRAGKSLIFVACVAAV